MRKRIWISSITISIIGLSILFALYLNNSLLPSQEIDPLPNYQESDIITIGPHYLSRPPYYPNNSNKITKIYLENAALWYDYTNISFTSKSRHYDFRGVEAVIINATLRNDYNVREITQFSTEGSSNLNVGIDVYMFEKNGDRVGTFRRGNPLRGCYELSLKSKQIVSINIVLATPKTIDKFEIYVSWLPDVQF